MDRIVQNNIVKEVKEFIFRLLYERYSCKSYTRFKRWT